MLQMQSDDSIPLKKRKIKIQWIIINFGTKQLFWHQTTFLAQTFFTSSLYSIKQKVGVLALIEFHLSVKCEISFNSAMTAA